MKLDKKQLLFIHNVLFNYVSTESRFSSQIEDAEDLMKLLSDELTKEEQTEKVKVWFSGRDQPDDECEDDCQLHDHEEEEEEEEEDDWGLPNLSITDDVLLDLEDIYVFDRDVEARGRLNFFWHGKDNVCVLLTYKDGKESEIPDVRSIIRQGKLLILTAKNGEFEFDVSKFPKQWTSALKANVKYNVK